MDLFEVLSNDERVIVLSDADGRYIVTWNKSLTLQLWKLRNGQWEEIDVRVLMETPSFEEAVESAKRWMKGEPLPAVDTYMEEEARSQAIEKAMRALPAEKVQAMIDANDRIKDGES